MWLIFLFLHLVLFRDLSHKNASTNHKRVGSDTMFSSAIRRRWHTQSEQVKINYTPCSNYFSLRNVPQRRRRVQVLVKQRRVVVGPGSAKQTVLLMGGVDRRSGVTHAEGGGGSRGVYVVAHVVGGVAFLKSNVGRLTTARHSLIWKTTTTTARFKPVVFNLSSGDFKFSGLSDQILGPTHFEAVFLKTFFRPRLP